MKDGHRSHKNTPADLSGYTGKGDHMRYYTFLFKADMNEAWVISVKFVAYNEDEAIERAIRYAEMNGYCDFILV